MVAPSVIYWVGTTLLFQRHVARLNPAEALHDGVEHKAKNGRDYEI